MVSNPRVSVLTPIYNVAQYLPQCLESLKAQTLQDIEFICINDGSTDNSLEILKAYAENDNRFVIIDKQNSGYGASMNKGLEAARGEYIGIVESDDFIDADAFELLYGIANLNNKPDIVKANHYQHNELSGDTFIENYKEELCDKVLSPVEEPGIKVINSIPAIWAAIYRSDFLRGNDIKFLETPGASFQDTGFVFKSWLAANAFVLCYAAFLHYRVDNASSSVKNPSKVFNVCDEFEDIEKFLDQRPDRKTILLPHLLAKKCNTYEWNLRRIDQSLRHGFLERYYSEFKKYDEQGLIQKPLYTKSNLKNLERLLEQPYSVMMKCKLDEAIDGVVKVSAIVPVYNAMPYLKRTLKCLKRQTLREIEIILVNDGSTDNSQAYIDEFIKQDNRFIALNQDNKGVAAARNLGLAHARGEYIAFCDADDVLPANAYESLYREAKLNDADMVVGREDEFSLTSKASYTRTINLANRKSIDKYDVDFNWNLSLCNKLFRGRIIREHDLKFGDAIITEDGIYLCQFLKYANRIYGCPKCVYRYRQHLFFESKSATQRIDIQAISSDFNSRDQVKNLREQCVVFDIGNLGNSENRDLLARQFRAKADLVSEDVDYRTLSYEIEKFYRWIWRLEDESLGYLVSRLSDLRDNKVYPQHWEEILSYNPDLRLDEGFLTQEELAQQPLISVILTPSIKQKQLNMHLDSLFLQKFPSFEVLLPENLKEFVDENLASLPNVHFVSASTRSNMINKGIEIARGTYINILEDQIYHTANTLREMWKEISESPVDFVSANLGGVSKSGNTAKSAPLMMSKILYSDEFVETPSYRSKYLALDSSPNNKLFRKDALRKIYPLTEDSVADTTRAFAELSFIKLQDTSMASFETDSFFIGRTAEPVKSSYKLFYRWREKHPYEPGEADDTDFVDKLPAVRHTRKQILFCSNREDGHLSASMKLVYDALPDYDKLVFCEHFPHSQDYLTRFCKALLQSKVIVTDDYIHELAKIDLREDQHVIQLWHACGAFKKFGVDNVACKIKLERAKHHQYDSVMVSDEPVRSIYAHAFGVSNSTIKALGVPRTDLLLDADVLEATRSKVYKSHPELIDKQVILYCPTFRENGRDFSNWDTNIDWTKLDRSLRDNQMLIVKKHPLDISVVCPYGQFDHILPNIDVGTDELITVSSLLITDCSSIVFDYSLLNKPMLFYFPDYDSFNRDYYINFPEDFDAQIEANDDDLAKSIQLALTHPEDYLIPSIRNGMMSACDGRSTKRIAAYIKKLMKS